MAENSKIEWADHAGLVGNPTGRQLGAYKSAAKKVGCTLEQWMAKRKAGLLHCRVCRSWLAADAFVVDRTRSTGRASLCRRCASEKQTSLRYGITVAQLRSMIALQGGICPICERSDERMEVDHCHDSGKVRDLLCSRCNGALGQFCDNIGLLKRAIAYLEKHDG